MAVPRSLKKHVEPLALEVLANEMGVASFGYVSRNKRKSDTKVSNSHACHIGLKHDKPRKCVAIVSSLMRGGSKKYELWEWSFVDWLINRSPWARVFYTKDASKALKEGYIVARTDVPCNLLVGAFIASRGLVEFREKIRVFRPLCKNGMNENLAYLICFSIVRDTSNLYKFVKLGEYTNHLPFNPSSISFKLFVNNKPRKRSLGPKWMACTRYQNINSVFAGDRGNNNYRRVADLYKKEIGTNKQSGNPFQRNNGNGVKKTSLNKACRVMAGLNDKIMKRCV